VDSTHRASTGKPGMPPMAKWPAALVKAVKVIMNTLVPTAVFGSYHGQLCPGENGLVDGLTCNRSGPENPQLGHVLPFRRQDSKAVFV